MSPIEAGKTLTRWQQDEPNVCSAAAASFAGKVVAVYHIQESRHRRATYIGEGLVAVSSNHHRDWSFCLSDSGFTESSAIIYLYR